MSPAPLFSSNGNNSGNNNTYQLGWFRFWANRNAANEANAEQDQEMTTKSIEDLKLLVSSSDARHFPSGTLSSVAGATGLMTLESMKHHQVLKTNANKLMAPTASMSIVPMEVDTLSVSSSSLAKDRNPLYIPEILEIIFSYLESSIITSTDPTQPMDFVKVDSIKYTVARPKLHNVVLVCKLWNACASKYLWRNIKVGNQINCQRLANAIASTGDQSLFQALKRAKMDFSVLRNEIIPQPSRVNNWIYGNLIKSLTLIPPNQSSGLDFEQWNVDELVSIVAFCCPKLEELSLSNCSAITDKPLVLLAKNCTNLRKINLNRCDLVTDVALSAFAKHLKHLELLNLNRPLLDARMHLSDQALRAVVSSNPKLRELRIRNCDKTTDETVIAIAKTAGKNLLALDLSWCGAITDRAITEGLSQSCTNLISLALNGCKFLTDASLYVLLSNFPNLKSLSMAHLPAVRDTVLSNMAEGLKNLVILSLNGCSGIRDPSVIALAKSCPKLQCLSLYSLEITDESVKEISSNCKNLISLSVSGCTLITDKGASHITKLEKLNSLYLNQSQITDRSLVQITNKCTRLRALSVNECSYLTDKSAAAIASWSNSIQSLSMNKTGITVVGVRLIVERCFDLRELSVKDCEGVVLRGPRAFEARKGSGEMSMYTAIGRDVLQLICHRRIALLIGADQ